MLLETSKQSNEVVKTNLYTRDYDLSGLGNKDQFSKEENYVNVLNKIFRDSEIPERKRSYEVSDKEKQTYEQLIAIKFEKTTPEQEKIITFLHFVINKKLDRNEAQAYTEILFTPITKRSELQKKLFIEYDMISNGLDRTIAAFYAEKISMLSSDLQENTYDAGARGKKLQTFLAEQEKIGNDIEVRKVDYLLLELKLVDCVEKGILTQAESDEYLALSGINRRDMTSEQDRRHGVLDMLIGGIFTRAEVDEYLALSGIDVDGLTATQNEKFMPLRALKMGYINRAQFDEYLKLNNIPNEQRTTEQQKKHESLRLKIFR